MATPQQPITLTDDAVKHLKRLREDSGGEEMLLRVGVKSGGCSGMSYTMDFEDGANIGKDDSIIEHEGFKLVCDSMSLLYLFGKSDWADWCLHWVSHASRSCALPELSARPCRDDTRLQQQAHWRRLPVPESKCPEQLWMWEIVRCLSPFHCFPHGCTLLLLY